MDFGEKTFNALAYVKTNGLLMYTGAIYQKHWSNPNFMCTSDKRDYGHVCQGKRHLVCVKVNWANQVCVRAQTTWCMIRQKGHGICQAK